MINPKRIWKRIKFDPKKFVISIDETWSMFGCFIAGHKWKHQKRIAKDTQWLDMMYDMRMAGMWKEDLYDIYRCEYCRKLVQTPVKITNIPCRLCGGDMKKKKKRRAADGSIIPPEECRRCGYTGKETVTTTMKPDNTLREKWEARNAKLKGIFK